MGAAQQKREQALQAGQLRLRLDQPLQHISVLHEGATRGTVILLFRGRPQGKPHWLKIPHDQLERMARQLQPGEVDAYLTVNRFFGWRRTDLLSDLCALFCEIDIDLVPGSRHTKQTRTEIDSQEYLNLVEKSLAALEAARLPPPTLIVYSAGGPQIYWIFDRPLPAAALPRWQMLQNRFIKVLAEAGCGVDTRAKDAARILREIGSVHGGTGRVITGEIYGPKYDFEFLNDQYAERSRAEIRDIRAERARQRQDLPAQVGNRGQKSIYSWWHLVYQDLLAIIDHHWFGGIPEGHRDEMLFLLGTALSWFADPRTLQDEIASLARQWTPSLPERIAISYAASVIKRAHDAADGKKYAWTQADGTQVPTDPRYRFKAETLYERLRPLITPELAPRLRAILPAEVRKERKNDGDRRRGDIARRAAGKDRVSELLEEASARGQAIAQMRSRKMKWDAIGLALGITTAAAKMALKRYETRTGPKKGTVM